MNLVTVDKYVKLKNVPLRGKGIFVGDERLCLLPGCDVVITSCLSASRRANMAASGCRGMRSILWKYGSCGKSLCVSRSKTALQVKSILTFFSDTELFLRLVNRIW